MARLPLSCLSIFLVLVTSTISEATISDFNSWSLVEDPSDPNLSANIDSATQATLTAVGPVMDGHDIGYASVDGEDVFSSTSGYYFSPSSDFTVAVDYSLFFPGTSPGSAMGGGGIGFGVGEDLMGANSTGVGLAFADSTLVGYGASGRVDDIDQFISFFTSPATLTGRFFVNYNSTTREFTLGISNTQGDGMSTESVISSVLQSDWNDKPLLVSFFLRSEEVQIPSTTTIPALSSGIVNSIFSNFEVLNGAPIKIPEPNACSLMLLALMTQWRFRSQARG